MTLEEILSNITILTNNCIDTTYITWVFAVWGSIIIVCSIIMLVVRLVTYDGPPIGISIVLLTSALLVTAWAIVVLCNEELQVCLTDVRMYVCLNDVTLEDISQYFKLSDTTAVNNQIYTNIEPISEYRSNICLILHNMQII